MNDPDADCFLIDEIANKLVISHTKQKSDDTNSSPIVVTYDSKFDDFTVEAKVNAEIEAIVNDFLKNLSSINLNDKQLNSVLKFSELLIERFSTVLRDSLEDIGEIFDKFGFLCRKFNERNTKPKRLKYLERNPLFVAAEKTSIGIKWKSKLDTTKEIPNHYLEQNDYSYASIIETIKSIVKRPGFVEVYLSYNLNKKHKCTEGTYEDYCCGKNAKKCPLFDDPRTVQIEVFADAFEVCSALKTKTVKHNVTGVYFRIRNLPAEYNSRLDNIHLIALVKVQDLKQDGVSFDNIVKKIVAEVRVLQTDGIELSAVWSILERLLKIVQIVFSTKITDNDLDRLKHLITEFLSGLIDNGVKLTPKLHNLTHYPTVIENMGPLIHIWTMRMEAKHRVFTRIANNSNCFVNITETLATRHQQTACLKVDLFSNSIVASKRKMKLCNSQNFEKYRESNVLDMRFENCDTHDFLKINSFEYRKGFVLFVADSILEIAEILNVENQFFFLCDLLKINEFNEHLNSIQILNTNEYI